MTEDLNALAARLGVTLGGRDRPREDAPPVDWRRRVQEAADEVASEAWEARAVPGELQRSDEIRRLTREQVFDDVYTMASGGRDRIGRQYVSHRQQYGDNEFEEHHRALWPARTEEDKALAVEMEAVLQEHLEGEDRVIVRLAYEGDQLSERELAERYHTSQPTLHRRLSQIRASLRDAMLRRYGMEVS